MSPSTAFRVSAALVFAAALAGTGYVLVRVWPAAPPLARERVAAALARNAVLFTLFAVHHSLLARPWLKARLRAAFADATQRSLYVWVASVLLLTTMFGWRTVGHTLYSLPLWLQPVMVTLQVAGIALVVVAARVVDPLELAGLRVRGAPRLEVRGPYRVVRHPIYLGFLLLAWAAPVMTADRAWFALLSTLYLLVAIPLEERAMARGLGAPYAAYRSAVRWRVVPGLY